MYGIKAERKHISHKIFYILRKYGFMCACVRQKVRLLRSLKTAI
jgi:hypothetical protein